MWAQRWIVALVMVGVLYTVKYAVGAYVTRHAAHAAAWPPGVVHGALPQDYPSDVPLYQPSRVVSSHSSQQPDSHSTSVMIEAGGDAASVFDFYRTEIPGHGWTVVERGVPLSGEVRDLSATNGNRHLYVVVQPREFMSCTVIQTVFEPK